MTLKDRLDVVEVFETWINGNISDAKLHIRRMDKAEFLDFIEHARANGIMPYKLRGLL
jgi:hypothetical protein